MHIKNLSQREVITEVNMGYFLIVSYMQEIIRDNLNVETRGQYWGIGIYVAWDVMEIFFIYTDLKSCKERQSFVIPVVF